MNKQGKLIIDNKEYDMLSPSSEEFKIRMIESFGDTYQEPINIHIDWNHMDGFQLILKSNVESYFDVKIYDKNDNILYETSLKNDMYCKLSRKYFNGIKYKIFLDGSIIGEETITFKNKRVYIAFDSSSLGDTLAWLPYCEEFRKKHECDVVVSTFLNPLFESTYPNLTFVKPGSVVHNLWGMFKLGWFYDENKEPEYPTTIPLQKAATNILGLDFTEIRPILEFKESTRPIPEKYITIGTSATAGCKEWNNPTGWQELVDHLNSVGYKVAVIQKEGIGNLKNVLNWTGNFPLSDRLNQLHHSEFFIGLGSGLSWLAWAMNKKVVMISNFSEDGHEFTDNTIRISNKSVCNGCWNNPSFKFDKGDWYWCPVHKGTDRQFECHKSITSEMVIDQIKHLLS